MSLSSSTIKFSFISSGIIVSCCFDPCALVMTLSIFSSTLWFASFVMDWYTPWRTSRRSLSGMIKGTWKIWLSIYSMKTGVIRAMWAGDGDWVGDSKSITSITRGRMLHKTPGSYSYLKFTVTKGWPWSMTSWRTQWRISWDTGNVVRW